MTKMRRLVVLAVVVLPLIASLNVVSESSVTSFHSAFHQSLACQDYNLNRLRAVSQRRPRRTSMQASIITDNGEDTPDWSPMELWLDLRGTAITSRMALSKLEEESPFAISKVLVSLQGAPRAVQLWKAEDPELLIVDESDNVLCDAKDPSIQYGMIVTVDGDSFVDPIPALETSSNGGWVLVDPEGSDEQAKERHEAISNLVNFIAGGLSLGNGSFLLGADTAEDVAEEMTYSNDNGGIAVVCRTKSDLVQAANTLQSISSGPLTATESGILLKADPLDSSSAKESLQSALVLPFDVPLWKAAIIIVAESSYSAN